MILKQTKQNKCAVYSAETIIRLLFQTIDIHNFSFINKILVHEAPEIIIYAAFKIHSMFPGVVCLIWIESSG